MKIDSYCSSIDIIVNCQVVSDIVRACPPRAMQPVVVVALFVIAGTVVVLLLAAGGTGAQPHGGR